MNAVPLLLGYLATVAIEGPILWFGVARRHASSTRLGAAAWLSAVTFPIVNLVIPELMEGYPASLIVIVAETFAPLAEVALFLGALRLAGVDPRPTAIRDGLVIILANLVSFGVGTLLFP